MKKSGKYFKKYFPNENYLTIDICKYILKSAGHSTF
jgi:hypothetical protein